MNKKVLFGILAVLGVGVVVAGAGAAYQGNTLATSVQNYGYGYGYGYGYVSNAVGYGYGRYGYGYDYDYVVVDKLYQDLLGRVVDVGGLLYYAGKTPSAIVADITTSTEYGAGQVAVAYNDVLGRTPDVGGLQYYLAKWQAGWSLDDIKADMYTSAEWITRTRAQTRLEVYRMPTGLLVE